MSDDLKLTELLQKISFFSELDGKVLESLKSSLEPESFKTGDLLCREGEDGDRMFVIESGEVSVMKIGERNVEIEVTTLGEGEVVGEMSLLGTMPRSASLKAKSDVKTWILSHDVFQDLIDTEPSLAKAVITALTHHLHRETSVVAKLLSKDMDHRFKIAFFDSKPYMKKAFDIENTHDFSISYYEAKLSSDTVSLAAGHDAVCVFVNDDVNTSVVEELSSMGVKMIALRCAGYNNVDLKTAEKEGVTVARVPAYSPYAVAEHAVALMMTLNRKVHRANNRVREGNFSLNGLVGFDMHGKTAGVVGTGKIGQCVCSILKGFRCELLMYNRTKRPELEEKFDAKFVDMDEIIEKCDVISLHVPLTPETHYIINEKSIKKMKDGVMIINTGRGPLIDTKALLEGLKTGKVGFAGLDVYEEESAYFFEDYSEDIMTDDTLARLTTFNNVIVTSHQAFLTEDALSNIAETTLLNINEFRSGKKGAELENAVTAS